MTPRQTGDGPSLFADAMMLLAGDGRFSISFEDLTGFSFDYPTFALPDALRIHGTPLCRYAKDAGGNACPQNKLRCNQRVIEKGSGRVGLCHLGLQEAVEPLRVNGRLLGMFYFGAIVPMEEEANSRSRLERTCGRLKLAPEPFLERWATLPRVTAREWSEKMEHFAAMVRLVTRLVSDLPLTSNGPLYGTTTQAARVGRCSPLTRKAVALITKRYAEPLTLAGCAAEFGCHPGYLSRLFKRETGVEFQRHLNRVRITHARELLRGRGMNGTQVAYETGFSDASHFCRVFRQLEGCTPGEYLRRA